MSQPYSPIDLWRMCAKAWIADQGDEGDGSRRDILDPALDPFLASISGKQVLDRGCGEGRFARRMRSNGAVVAGIDPVAKFIERAIDRDPDGDYQVAFAESLPFADCSFDAAISYLTIMDIEDYDRAASEMVRVVRPGGSIVLVLISNFASPSD